MKMNVIFGIVLVLMIHLLVSNSTADTIYLKNGQKFHGQLIHVTKSEGVVKIGDFQTSYDLSAIDWVEDETGTVLFKDGEVKVTDLSTYDNTNTDYTYRAIPSLSPQMVSRALEKGSTLLGGLISFSSVGGDLYGVGDDRSNLLTVAPNIINFLINNFGFGVDADYTRTWVDKSHTDQLVLGPKIMYVIPRGSTIRPYLGTGIGLIMWGSGYNGNSVYDFGLTAKGAIGVLFFLNEHYATTMELGMRWDRWKPEHSDESIWGNTIVFDIGFSGFIY